MDHQNDNEIPATIESRIKFKTIQSMKFRGLGLLRQVALEDNRNHKNDNENHHKLLTYFLHDLVYKEIESYPMKMYVLLHLFDRFLCWNNIFKFENWFKKRYENADEEEFLNSSVFWPIHLEHELVLQFFGEIFSSTNNENFSEFLRQELNLELFPTTEMNVSGFSLRPCQSSSSSSSITYKQLFRIRSEQIINKINKPGILRFDELTELHCSLNVKMIRDICSPTQQQENENEEEESILPNNGADFDRLQIVPRGAKHGNLFVFSEEEGALLDITDNDSSTSLDFDTAFHTSSSEFMILFPSINDLFSQHYKRLEHRASKRLKLLQCQTAASSPNEDKGTEFEYCRLVADQNTKERCPFLTCFPRFLVTMSHEANHITQGIVNQSDTSFFKMASEHDPSVFETPLSYQVAKKYEKDENLSFLFPPGLGEVSSILNLERHHFMLTKLMDPEKFTEHFEEFLRSFGLYQVEDVIRRHFGDGGEEQEEEGHQHQESAWSVANFFAYCQAPGHFTTCKKELRSLFKLCFGRRRWHVKLYDEENVRWTRTELERMIHKSKEVKDPVEQFRNCMKPPSSSCVKCEEIFKMFV